MTENTTNATVASITSVAAKAKIKHADGIVTISGLKPEQFLPEGTDAGVFGLVDTARDNLLATALNATTDYAEKHKLVNYNTKPISLGGATSATLSAVDHKVTSDIKQIHNAELQAAYAKSDDYAKKQLEALNAPEVAEAA